MHKLWQLALTCGGWIDSSGEYYLSWVSVEWWGMSADVASPPATLPPDPMEMEIDLEGE